MCSKHNIQKNVGSTVPCKVATVYPPSCLTDWELGQDFTFETLLHLNSFKIGFLWIEFLFHGITSSFSKRILLTNARYKFLSELKKRSPVLNVKNGTKVIGNNDMEPLITTPGSETGLSGSD